MDAVLINVVETVRNARKLAKTLGNLNACEFEIVDALQGKTDEEILEIVKEDVNSNVNKELGLLFTIKNNIKTLNSFHFELYNKEFRIIKDSDIFDILLEEIEDVYQPRFPLVIKLSDNDVRIIKETYNAAAKTADFVVLNKLTAKIEEVTGIKNEMGNTREFIQTILKDYNYYTQNM